MLVKRISFKTRGTLKILCIFFQTSSKKPNLHRWKTIITICNDFQEEVLGITMPERKARNGCRSPPSCIVRVLGLVVARLNYFMGAGF